MRRKRVTGRFYLFLGLLLIGGYFILRELLPDKLQVGLVQSGNAQYSYTVDAVIIRDEVVSSYEGAGLVVYEASEGQQVNEGDQVCVVYTAGYAEKELDRLETVRASIRSYHEKLLDDENILEGELERLEKMVQDIALERKTLILSKSGGSLLNLERQLEQAMVERQDYLRKNMRQDYQLNDLYDQEEKRMGAIESWQTKAVAPKAGLVSFYLDGYEQYLSASSLESLTPAQIRTVLAGRTLADTVSRLTTNIFKVVSTDRWYIVLLSSDVNWNPSADQSYTFQLEGYPGAAYTGRVISMQKSSNEVMAVLEVAGSPGALINVRSGKADIGAFLTGLSVPVKAVSSEGGQTGVWLADAAGSTFIPVNVLSQDSSYALIQPITEGTLSVGQQVLIR